MIKRQTHARGPMFVVALGLAVAAWFVPSSTSAMSACNPEGCTYFLSGGGTVEPAPCKPYSDHCHCFNPANPEEDQHQTACSLPSQM
jgi:hypothetical protein